MLTNADVSAKTGVENLRMLTYADEPTYADVCRDLQWGDVSAKTLVEKVCWRMLTYADICLQSGDVSSKTVVETYADVC